MSYAGHPDLLARGHLALLLKVAIDSFYCMD